jgi:hypothetical protein
LRILVMLNNPTRENCKRRPGKAGKSLQIAAGLLPSQYGPQEPSIYSSVGPVSHNDQGEGTSVSVSGKDDRSSVGLKPDANLHQKEDFCRYLLPTDTDTL